MVAPDENQLQKLHEAGSALLDLVERKIGSAAFIEHFTAVQRRIQASKLERRRVQAAEAVLDPRSYARRKIAKTEKKKASKKRKSIMHSAIKVNSVHLRISHLFLNKY